jgi:hypothetical protein
MNRMAPSIKVVDDNFDQVVVAYHKRVGIHAINFGIASLSSSAERSV